MRPTLPVGEPEVGVAPGFPCVNPPCAIPPGVSAGSCPDEGEPINAGSGMKRLPFMLMVATVPQRQRQRD